ncbi:hypothetical protein [Sphingomonas sp. S2-65]|uniref:hypothetical protein n=1 Tax=Sphingomonas sp. S2-65 TaxID=2903960 RepID=UPI001F19A880|nr:hypothetical protein [Sphingomonas sp. S2-65]UYY59607.1 hypothetical protein LZ586_05855 [Sphingomonas sp. S2-65]
MHDPATLVESHAIHPTRTDRFVAWRDAYVDAIGAAPGHRATTEMEQPGGLNHLFSWFETAADLDAWTKSDSYRRLSEARDAFTATLVQRGTGSALRFEVPSEATARKWKRFLVTWCAVLPILLALNTAVRTLFPGLPPLVQLCVTSPILTALLTWVVLPRIQRWSSYWLLQDRHGRLSKHPD